MAQRSEAEDKLLGRGFFEGPTLKVAETLLGKRLCRKVNKGDTLRGVITEVEAYDGPHDKACHAHRGKGPRNSVMFGQGGYWYVYFCYGIHWILNIVTGPENYPASLLIRGVDSLSGPARLTKYFSIDKSFDGKICKGQRLMD